MRNLRPRSQGIVSAWVPVLLAASIAVAARTAGAKPILFPATPRGAAEWRDERDVAPWIAAWKADAFRREQNLRSTATANQQAYDVKAYDLDLTFSPSASRVSGTVRTRASVVTAPLTTLDLDLLANMVVDGVTSAGIPTSFTRLADVLTVNLDRAYAAGEGVDVRVTYHGTPVAGSCSWRTL